MKSKEYEKCRADISKHFKSEVERLKLDIIKLKNENASLQVENFTLKRDIQKYKNKLESISDSQKSLLGMTEAIKYLI